MPRTGPLDCRQRLCSGRASVAVAGRVCTQCGGPLEPGSAVCPWCRTPVSVPTRAVVERVNPSDSDPELDDDTDDEPDNTRLMVGGGLAFTMATVFSSSPRRPTPRVRPVGVVTRGRRSAPRSRASGCSPWGSVWWCGGSALGRIGEGSRTGPWYPESRRPPVPVQSSRWFGP